MRTLIIKYLETLNYLIYIRGNEFYKSFIASHLISSKGCEEKWELFNPFQERLCANTLYFSCFRVYTQSTNSNTIIEFPVCIQNNFSSRILLYCEFLADSMPFDNHHVYYSKQHQKSTRHYFSCPEDVQYVHDIHFLKEIDFTTFAELSLLIVSKNVASVHIWRFKL